MAREETKKKEDVKKEVALPEGVTATLENGVLTVKGPKGELSREFRHPKVRMELKGSTVTVSSEVERRKVYAVIGAWAAHVRNMGRGVSHGWESRMKAVYSHFPVKLNVEGSRLVIQNFMGERKSRSAKIVEGVKVEVKKDEIIVTGIDKDKVGQTCGNIENVARVKGRDRRIFQDGVYILDKPAPMSGGEKK